MSLNDSLSEDERAKLAVWDYPVSDKYTKIWAQILEAKLPKSLLEGLRRVKEGDQTNEQFALMGKDLHLHLNLNCNIFSVCLLSGIDGGQVRGDDQLWPAEYWQRI